jgi:beta-galactosidase
MAAVVHQKLGKGTVTYIGADTDNGQFETDVITRLYKTIGLTTEQQPEGLVKLWRSGFWIAINYNSQPVKVNVPANATYIIGKSPVLQLAEVLVWKE